MRTVYRVIRQEYAAEAFEGIGAYLAGGRFNSPRKHAVYTSESLSLAVLEKMVHLEDYQELVDQYMVVAAQFDPEKVSILKLEVPSHADSLGTLSEAASGSLSIRNTDLRESITGSWRRYPYPVATRRIGDRWIEAEASPVLRIPSAVVPREFNYLVNPRHPDMDQIEVMPPEQLTIDPRIAEST